MYSEYVLLYLYSYIYSYVECVCVRKGPKVSPEIKIGPCEICTMPIYRSKLLLRGRQDRKGDEERKRWITNIGS